MSLEGARAREDSNGRRIRPDRNGILERPRPFLGAMANFGQRTGQASQNPVEEVQAGVVLPLPRKALRARAAGAARPAAGA